MRNLLIGLVMLMLAGCGGSGQVLLTYHEVDQAFLATLSDSSRNIGGYAIWDHELEQSTCDIYMLPKAEYGNVDEYHRVLGHETRHCFEGAFH